MNNKFHDLNETRYGCEILFAQGGSVFLQGDDASRLIEEIEVCETPEAMHAILDEYTVLIEE